MHAVNECLIPFRVQAPPCSNCIAIHNKGIGRLNLTTWFVLLMISICFADGEARDSVNQGYRPHSETGALTPEEEEDDMSQPDMCPLPFTVWFGGKACPCLLLACACCCLPDVQGSRPSSACKLLCRAYTMSSAMHWCMTLRVKCLKWRATNKMTAVLAGKQSL